MRPAHATTPDSGRLLFLGAAVAFAAVVALGATAIASYVSAAAWLDQTLQGRVDAHEWTAAMTDIDTNARGYVTTGATAFLDPYEAGVARARREATLLQNEIADRPEQAKAVEFAARDAERVFVELREMIALAKAGHRDEAAARLTSGESKKRLDAYQADMTLFRSEERRLLLLQRSTAATKGRAALLAALLVTLVSSAFLVLAWRRERSYTLLTADLARDARDRLAALSTLAGALAQARSRADVVTVIVEQAARATGADTCAVYELDEAGVGLDLVGEHGVAPGVTATVRRITASSGNPRSFAAMKAGTSVWVESLAEYEQLYPELATLNVVGRRANAFWSVPLVAEGRSLGLLGMGFYGARVFAPDERAFVETLTNHCAQALVRASRLEREDDAQRQLATTLRSIGDAVIATDAEGRVTFMNAVAEALTGWPEAEARGRPLDEVFCIRSEVTRAVVESPVTKVLREGSVVGLAKDTMLRSREGREIPIDDSGAPIRNEQGAVRGVVLVFRDVTQEKRAQARTDFLAKAGEALASSMDYEATLATVARFAVPTLADWCAVELVDPDTGTSRQAAVAHVDEAKMKSARDLGARYPPDPEATTGVPQVIRSGTSELYAEIPQALLEAGARDAEHLRMLRALELRSVMIVPLRVRDRTFGAMTFVHADSDRRYGPDDLAFAEDFARRAAMAIENALALKETERSRTQERALRDEAEVANRAKDEFLATVSHELRTPLNAILGWTVLLRKKELPKDVEHPLTVIERNARLQQKLIEDVLDISRIISGKLALNLGPANVGDVIAAAVETVIPAADAKGIHIDVDVSDPSLGMTADADRLQQVIWNLLSNAVKFTPKQGHVKVLAAREGSEISVSVSDTGEGIRADVLPLVFEPFRQADASTTRRHGGLGLGLAIVKQITTAHGGTVHAESQGEGKGATLRVSLPARSTPGSTGAMSASLYGSGGVHAKQTGPRLDGLRILLVDDEADALGFVSSAFRDAGAEVHTFLSARDALERFGEVRPDVVVSDIGMPEIDGFSFIRQIRSLRPDQGGRTPAIALTAYARSEDAQRAFAAGYQNHLSKPVETSRLATVVANLGGRTVGS